MNFATRNVILRALFFGTLAALALTASLKVTQAMAVDTENSPYGSQTQVCHKRHSRKRKAKASEAQHQETREATQSSDLDSSEDDDSSSSGSGAADFDLDTNNGVMPESMKVNGMTYGKGSQSIDREREQKIKQKEYTVDKLTSEDFLYPISKKDQDLFVGAFNFWRKKYGVNEKFKVKWSKALQVMSERRASLFAPSKCNESRHFFDFFTYAHIQKGYSTGENMGMDGKKADTTPALGMLKHIENWVSELNGATYEEMEKLRERNFNYAGGPVRGHALLVIDASVQYVGCGIANTAYEGCPGVYVCNFYPEGSLSSNERKKSLAYDQSCKKTATEEHLNSFIHNVTLPWYEFQFASKEVYEKMKENGKERAADSSDLRADEMWRPDEHKGMEAFAKKMKEVEKDTSTYKTDCREDTTFAERVKMRS